MGLVRENVTVKKKVCQIANLDTHVSWGIPSDATMRI
jgi:hypothetical protein